MALIKTIVHQFQLGDVDDVEIYAAQPIWEWQQTEAGKWCMENCVPDSLTWTVANDMPNWGHQVTIHGVLSEENYTYWRLKYQ